MWTTRRRALALVPALALGAVLAGCGAGHGERASCAVTVSGGRTVVLDVDQTANAATIAAVARRMQMPDHAVTIALATAMQESKLRNLDHGDRDSLGLFQQRPSQGWGTPEQVRTPSYAAAAFYRRLATVPGWQALPLTVAAQAVQRSAYPEAYGKHEDDARALARGGTGQVPAALSCRHLPEADGLRGDEVRSAARTELGPAGLQPADDGGQWAGAFWLVAHARAYGVTEVTAGGQRWTARTGTWAPVEPGPDRLSWS